MDLKTIKLKLDEYGYELDDIELEDDNTSFVSYRPTSFGEELDFWFEIDFKVENEQLTAVFDINF